MSKTKGLRWGAAVVLLVALVVAATATVAGAASGAQAVTVGGVSPEKPSVSGGRVVWPDYRRGQWDIWLYDAATRKSTQITQGTGDKLMPSISGDTVAYVQYNPVTGADVYAYDVVSGQTRALSALAGDQVAPVVSGSRVAWVDASLSLPKIIVHNMVAGTFTTVPSVFPALNTYGRNGSSRPALSGDWVVFEEKDMTDNSNISAYNLVTAEKVQVAGGTGSELLPAIDGDRIAYVRMSGATGADICLFDLASRTTTVISDRPGEQTLPSLGNGMLYWVENTAGGLVVVGKNLATGASAPLNAGAPIAGYTASADARAWLQMVGDRWVIKAQFGLPVAGAGSALSMAPANPAWSALRAMVSARSIDGNPPVPMSASVEPGARNVARDGSFKVFFSEDMKASSVNASSVKLIDSATGAPVAATVSYSTAARAAVIDPDAPLGDGTYTLEVAPSVADVAGNVAGQGLAVAFSTNEGGPMSLNPPERVSTVKTTVVDTFTVNVQWTASADIDGDLVGYRIYRTTTASATPSLMTLVKTVPSSTLATNVSVATTEVATKFTMYYTVKAYDSTPLESTSWMLDAPTPHGTYSAIGGTNTCSRCHAPHGGALAGSLGALGARGAFGCYKCHGSTTQTSQFGANSLNNIQSQFFDYSASPMPANASRHGNAYLRAQSDNQQCDMCHSPHKRPYSETSSTSYGDLLKRPSTVNTSTATVLSADNAPFGKVLCYSCHGSGVNTNTAPLGYMTVMGGTTAYDAAAGDHNQAGWDSVGTAHGSLLVTDVTRAAFPNGGAQPNNSCQVCHDQHGSPAASLLQYRRSAPASDGVVDQSAMCFNCHSGGAAADGGRGAAKPNLNWNGRDVKAQFTNYNSVFANTTGKDVWSSHTYSAQQRLYSSSTSDTVFTGYTFSNTAVNGSFIQLTAGQNSGNFISSPQSVSGTLNRWISATVTGTIPVGTTCTVEVLDNANAVIAGIPSTPATLSAGKTSITVPLLTVNPVAYPIIKVRVNYTRAGGAATQTIDAVRVDWQSTNVIAASSLACYNCHNTHFVGTGSVVTSPWALARYSDPYDTNVTNSTLSTTDFCIRCHQSVAAANFPGARFASAARLTPYPVAFQSISATFFPSWDKSSFTSSGHFTTNGTKALCENCHDPHGSNNARLAAWTRPDSYAKISGSRDNTSTSGAESNLCFNCHGQDGRTVAGYAGATAVTGSANVRMNVASPTAASYGHTSTIMALSDRHSDVETAGDLIGAANRHVECVDCHEPHEAQAGTHTAGVSTAAPVLRGVRGIVPTYSTIASWIAPTSWEATTLGQGNSYESYLCFKCHSSYLPGWSTVNSVTAPSGGYKETDVALEFNPNNASGHSVMGPNYLGRTWPTTAVAGAYTWAPASTLTLGNGYTSTSKMTCSDCHNYNSTAARGPHGSTSPFLLKYGPTTGRWYTTQVGTWGNANTFFCAGCHTANSHQAWYAQTGSHNRQCQHCHVTIPHGWKRPRLLLRGTDTAPYKATGDGNITGFGIGNRTETFNTKTYCSDGCSTGDHPNQTAYW